MGQEFLIAPIVDKANRKQVYFPQGTKYLEYFEKEHVYNGGDKVTFELDIDTIPAFIRERSIITRRDITELTTTGTQIGSLG